MAAADEVCRYRRVASDRRHTVSAKLFARAESVLRSLVLEREELAARDGTAYASLSSVQGVDRGSVSALLDPVVLALRFRGCCGVCRGSDCVAAADDPVFPSALVGFAGV